MARVSGSDVQRWAAFSSDPAGGNPAGVLLDARGLDDADMLRIATEVGYSETAFVTPTGDPARRDIRFFSPNAEVPFCGHATVASAASIAEEQGDGTIAFTTPVGVVEIETVTGPDGRRVSFTSVAPEVEPLTGRALDDVLSTVGLGLGDLHPDHAPAIAFAGNRHPLVVLADRATFDDFTIDRARARAVLDAHGWPATIGMLWPESPELWHARHVFPVGGIVEDPATGAGAAATGGYLRETGALRAPAHAVILQGRHVGRPSELSVAIPMTGGIVVSGAAVRLD